MKINIAIDGPSAAGKSTIAQMLASKLNYVHIDTGAMYRCVALSCIRNNVNLLDEKEIVQEIGRITITLLTNNQVLLNSEDVSLAIRTSEIALAASNISKFDKVRTELVKLQRELAKDKGYIMDGRDITSVVLKDAEIKVFLTASVLDRAKRRHLQNIKNGIDSDLDDIQKDIKKRDDQDTNRIHSPLIVVEDALIIDSTLLDAKAVVDVILNKMKELGYIL